MATEEKRETAKSAKQEAKTQRLQVVRVEKSGAVEVAASEEKWKTVEDIFAAGWDIGLMTQIADEHVLLLLERDRPKPAGDGRRVWGERR